MQVPLGPHTLQYQILQRSSLQPQHPSATPHKLVEPPSELWTRWLWTLRIMIDLALRHLLGGRFGCTTIWVENFLIYSLYPRAPPSSEAGKVIKQGMSHICLPPLVATKLILILPKGLSSGFINMIVTTTCIRRANALSEFAIWLQVLQWERVPSSTCPCGYDTQCRLHSVTHFPTTSMLALGISISSHLPLPLLGTDINAFNVFHLPVW